MALGSGYFGNPRTSDNTASLSSGGSFTLTGSGFGTKSRALAPLVDDHGQAGAGVLDSQWSGAYPQNQGTIYDQQNQVGATFNPNSNGIGAVGTPHRGITNIMAGCAKSFTSDAWNMSPYKSYTNPGLPYAYYCSCWFCADYGWNFGLGHSPANNWKIAGPSNSTGQVGNPNTLDWFCAANQGGPPWASHSDGTVQIQFTDNDTALIFPDAAGHSAFWGQMLNPFNFPVNGWILFEVEVIMSSTNALPGSGGGRCTVWQNGTQIANLQGRTVDTSDVSHFLRVGPHIFTTDAGATTQFTYGAGYYLDATATLGGSGGQVGRVYACNASTYAASAIRVPQNLNGGSWANTQIQSGSNGFNPGPILPGQTAYFSVMAEGSLGAIDGVTVNGRSSVTVGS